MKVLLAIQECEKFEPFFYLIFRYVSIEKKTGKNQGKNKLKDNLNLKILESEYKNRTKLIGNTKPSPIPNMHQTVT